jgi:uncharacterized protein (DUF362 family)
VNEPSQELLSVHPILPYLERLATLAHPEGGWGYAPNQAIHLEPTCLSLLALAHEPERFKAVTEQGYAALQRALAADGAWRLPEDREESIWPTALVLLVQASRDPSSAEVRKTVARLLAWKGRKPDADQSREVHDIDLNLTGWPWAVDNFAWVEPTAWACLALNRAGHGNHPRVQEGFRLLLDRAFENGGINYGNRTVLGRRTQPMPGPTALMLLALQHQGQEPRVGAAVDYLRRHASASVDLEHLCWAKLALTCHCDQPSVQDALPVLDERILTAYEARNEATWLRPAPVREALTVLALQSETDSPFRLSQPTSRSDEDATPYSVLSTRYSSPRRSWTQRLASKFRGLAVNALGHLRPAPGLAAVHIAKATDYSADLADIFQRQYELFRERVPLKGKRVVLKPNLVEYHRDKVMNTHPSVVAAVIELCRQEGAAEVIVAEGPGHWRNAEYLVQASGFGEVLRHYGVPFVDVNHDEAVKTPNLGRLTGLEYLYLSRTVASAEVLISLPKLKTHHWAGATLSLKNLFGTLPGICYGWPKNELHWRGIDRSIIDIALTRPADLAIVDGIVGMEGDGPINGTAKPMGVLVMGTDCLAVDATCCRLMQLEPEKLRYLVMGHQKKLGQLRATAIQQLGESIDSLAQPFETVEHFQGLRMSRPAMVPCPS